MTGKKQVFIGFPLNFTGLNMMKKQKNRFLKKSIITLYFGQLSIFLVIEMRKLIRKKYAAIPKYNIIYNADF